MKMTNAMKNITKELIEVQMREEGYSANEIEADVTNIVETLINYFKNSGRVKRVDYHFVLELVKFVLDYAYDFELVLQYEDQ